MSYAGVDYDDDSYYLARAREENTKLRQQIAELEAKVLKLTPKPTEPRGLGAVVKDRAGNRWIRHGDGPSAWMLAGASPDGRDTIPWRQLDAVEVLSDGVTP